MSATLPDLYPKFVRPPPGAPVNIIMTTRSLARFLFPRTSRAFSTSVAIRNEALDDAKAEAAAKRMLFTHWQIFQSLTLDRRCGKDNETILEASVGQGRSGYAYIPSLCCRVFTESHGRRLHCYARQAQLENTRWSPHCSLPCIAATPGILDCSRVGTTNRNIESALAAFGKQ